MSQDRLSVSMEHNVQRFFELDSPVTAFARAKNGLWLTSDIQFHCTSILLNFLPILLIVFILFYII